MDTSRISSIVDTNKMAKAHVVVAGLGGAMSICEALVRCGVGSITAIDPDTVDETNLARQGHSRVGEKKVRAAETRFREINPELDYRGIALRTEQIPLQHWEEILQDADLLIMATDSFEAQAFGNRLALMMNLPTLWIGLYAGAKAAEIVWVTPTHKDCFRCLLEHRYMRQNEQPGDPVSDGALYQDLQIVDGTAGHLALGLITRGADNYFGQLIDNLGDRQFLQIKLRHDWLLAGTDPVAAKLGIDPANDAYFCWNSVVRRNGPRIAACPDCIEFRNRTFSDEDFIAVEVDATEVDQANAVTPTSEDIGL